jgi:hypothetical protein
MSGQQDACHQRDASQQSSPDDQFLPPSATQQQPQDPQLPHPGNMNSNNAAFVNDTAAPPGDCQLDSAVQRSMHSLVVASAPLPACAPDQQASAPYALAAAAGRALGRAQAPEHPVSRGNGVASAPAAALAATDLLHTAPATQTPAVVLQQPRDAQLWQHPPYLSTTTSASAMSAPAAAEKEPQRIASTATGIDAATLDSSPICKPGTALRLIRDSPSHAADGADVPEEGVAPAEALTVAAAAAAAVSHEDTAAPLTSCTPATAAPQTPAEPPRPNLVAQLFGGYTATATEEGSSVRSDAARRSAAARRSDGSACEPRSGDGASAAAAQPSAVVLSALPPGAAAQPSAVVLSALPPGATALASPASAADARADQRAELHREPPRHTADADAAPAEAHAAATPPVKDASTRHEAVPDAQQADAEEDGVGGSPACRAAEDVPAGADDGAYPELLDAPECVQADSQHAGDLEGPAADAASPARIVVEAGEEVWRARRLVRMHLQRCPWPWPSGPMHTCSV